MTSKINQLEFGHLPLIHVFPMSIVLKGLQTDPMTLDWCRPMALSIESSQNFTWIYSELAS